jgi:hypothetical protein
MKGNFFEKFNKLARNPFYFYSEHARITDSVTSGLLLSYLVYLDDTMDANELAKTDADLCEELCMGLYELKGAKKRLQELNLVTITRRGLPARSYYSINTSQIITLINNLKTIQNNKN